MAEFVQQSIEETIPELEQLEYCGLFANEEIKAIIKKRTHYEYRIVRRQHGKEDFLKYIQYEVNLLNLIKKRRNRLNYSFKKDEIEMAIIRRILKLFRRACTQSTEDLRLWSSYIDFAKKWSMTQELSRIFAKALKVHSNNPALWIMAAKFEMEYNNSSDNARGLMLRALRHHPKAHKLWTEYFRLELMNADKQRKRFLLLRQSQLEPDDDDMSDAILQGEVAKMVYRQAVEQMPDDIGLHLAFIPICQRFEFTQDIVDEIYQDLEKRHSDSEIAWDALARRHLSTNTDIMDDSVELTEEARCLEVYEDAVNNLPTTKMWSMYVEFCLERLERGGSVQTSKQRANITIDTLEKAHKICDKLPEELFNKWTNTLVMLGCYDDAVKTAQSGVSQHPSSVQLWCQYIQLVIRCGDVGNGDAEEHKLKVRTLFDEAITKVKSKDSTPLWNVGIGWCLSNDADKVETLLQVGIREHKHVALKLKEHYLDWAAMQTGIKTIRRVYALLVKEKPLSLEFFRKYIAIENMELEPKMKHIRNCFEDALREFGSTEPELWLDYIKLELTHPNGNPSNASSLHWRAMQNLQGDHVETFTIRYTLMQTGH